MYMLGFHPMKAHPAHSMESHHYCRQVNRDLAQCALFDGSAPEANGIEYIISEEIFGKTRHVWHTGSDCGQGPRRNQSRNDPRQGVAVKIGVMRSRGIRISQGVRSQVFRPVIPTDGLGDRHFEFQIFPPISVRKFAAMLLDLGKRKFPNPAVFCGQREAEKPIMSFCTEWVDGGVESG
jgi:hypothetical protein